MDDFPSGPIPPPVPRSPKDTLFLAIFPDPETAQHIHAQAPALLKQLGLTRRLRPLTHLHVTLYFIDYCAKVTPDTLQAVQEACQAVAERVSAFDVILDGVMSFRNRKPDNCPLVLINLEENGNSALKNLYKTLTTELGKRRCWNNENPKNYVPHLTLAYDRDIREKLPFGPVSWPVREIALIHSEAGATRYHRLASWQLRG